MLAADFEVICEGCFEVTSQFTGLGLPCKVISHSRIGIVLALLCFTKIAPAFLRVDVLIPLVGAFSQMNDTFSRLCLIFDVSSFTQFNG